MPRFARMVEVVVDAITTAAPAATFPAELARHYKPVPDQVGPGWIRTETGEWREPGGAPPPPVQTRKVLSPVEFRTLFTLDEEIAIRAFAALADQAGADDNHRRVKTALLRFDDLRVQTVDVGSAAIRDVLDVLRSVNLLTQTRRDAIAAGVPGP